MCRSEDSPIPASVMPSHQLVDKIVKPRLPRKLAASARINLNRYWHALEELMPVNGGCRRPFDEADANAINDNIDNERRLAEMQLAEIRRRDRLGHDSDASCFKASTNDFQFQESSSSSTALSEDTPMDENTPPPSSPGAGASR